MELVTCIKYNGYMILKVCIFFHPSPLSRLETGRWACLKTSSKKEGLSMSSLRGPSDKPIRP
jgi:hypothetical protein